MKIRLFLTLLIFVHLQSGISQNLLTVAEKSDFKSTSEHKDVIDFINNLKLTSGYIRIESIALSNEGKDIPLLVIGNPLPESAESMKDDKRIVIYIQGNIHAGEVEGKEASLMFARDILKTMDQELFKNVVILICPILNPDGNDMISTGNRTSQNGPVNGVGVRHNGQFLDLNRDALKAESPEVRGLLINVFNRWDPAVFIDCHTTNGSYHVEPVTFTWMVNPNGDNRLISYMSETMMPELSATLLKKYKVENCFYGEFFDMMDPLKGWVMEACEPRYMTNYFGLRNRLAILNENYVYSDFRTRVWGCYYLLNSLCDYVKKNKSEIKKLISDADARTLSRGSAAHGADSFAIEYDSRLNQGHYMNTAEGSFVSEVRRFPAGTYVIKLNQPLANVCAYLLEPQSGDGLFAWNFLDRYLVPQWGPGYYPYPVYKLMDNTAMNTVTYCN